MQAISVARLSSLARRARLLGIVSVVQWSTLRAQATPANTPDSGPRVLIVGKVRSPAMNGVSAQITLLDAQRVDTDSSGTFHALLPSGVTAIHIRAVGFAPLDTQVVVSQASRDFVFLLSRGTVTLPMVATTASVLKPARYAETTKYDEFYERRHTAIGGTFITREDIEKSSAVELVDLLRGISGVKIERNRFGQPTVVLDRCKMSISDKPSGTAAVKAVQVFVDGRKMQDGFDTLQMFKTGDAEAVEVYTSVASLPLAARGDGCGAIFVWTH